MRVPLDGLLPLSRKGVRRRDRLFNRCHIFPSKLSVSHEVLRSTALARSILCNAAAVRPGTHTLLLHTTLNQFRSPCVCEHAKCAIGRVSSEHVSYKLV